MTKCPYHSLPTTAFWSKTVAGIPSDTVDPLVSAPFLIGREDRVATGGSCFAQHVARYLANSGFNYFVPETAPSFFTAAHARVYGEAIARQFGYGVFSARYGNIYTTRQLVQLFDRAFGAFTPIEDCWRETRGIIDPFRPNIQPAAFASEDEMREDRRRHLAAVRAMFEELDVFIFTLGLTETWLHADDGAAFPICPGCGGGSFDPAKHLFHNMTVAEVESDLEAFVERLRGVNPSAKIVLTVSPVPLIATASGAHVLSATTYSKAVLRVAAETLSRRHEHIAYFPSFEVITGAHARGAYYADDLRDVREVGVAHAMHLFFKHFTESGAPLELAPTPTPIAAEDVEPDVVDSICDERLLEAGQ